MNKKTDLVEQAAQNNAVALFAADAGLGLENADKDSFALPFLQILQGLSPQLEKVEGARPGLFINTITNELFQTPEVIPCYYQRRFLRWAPREAGGGLKGEYTPADIETGRIPTMRNERGQLTIEGDVLKDTRNHYVLVKSANGTWQPALLSLASTQIKKSKRWMSLIQSIKFPTPDGDDFNPASFSHIYTLHAVKEENNLGSWWGIEIALKEQVTDGYLYQKAKNLFKIVKGGFVEVQQPQAEDVPW